MSIMVKSKSDKIPVAVAAMVNQVLSGSHDTLNSVFKMAGAPGDPPQLSHATKWKTWLLRANDDPDANALNVLGKVLEEFMEVAPPGTDSSGDVFGLSLKSPFQEWLDKKSRVEKALSSHGLQYQKGGQIVYLFTSAPTESMHTALANRDIKTVEIEFKRALQTVETDPGAAITAGCALLEALFREYIQACDLKEPSKLNLKSLWSIVQQNMGFSPKRQTDEDIQRIFSGMTSIIDGIASLRTHGGSAHGGGKLRYSMRPRHARLLVNSAHTLAAFVLETWAEKVNQSKK